MPTAKLNVVQLMDHGIVAPTAVQLREVAPAQASPSRSPGEIDANLMAVAGRVKFTPEFAKVGQAVLSSRDPETLAAHLIAARYQRLKGARGFLGAPKTPVTRCPDKQGYFRHYAGGSIYWHPRSGAHEVHGDIRALWASLQWERGFLGYPRTDETVGRDAQGRGRFNHFMGGSIFWHPDTGAHEVHGAIRAKYFELGAEASFLGYPITHETKTPDGVGRFNHFQGGSIYWTPRTWAHEVHGLIRGFWAQHGWERNGELGYPISDERIPDRGVGHRNNLTLVLPTLAATGLQAVPAEQPSPLLTAVKPVTLQPQVMTRAVAPKPTRTTAKRTTAKTVTTTAKLATPTLAVRPEVLVAGRPLLVDPSRLRRDHTGPSQDRTSDFEDGVLFWRRGAKQAEMLKPRAKAPGGTKTAWTAAEIAKLAGTQIKSALSRFPGGAVQTIGFGGTTDYSWDGAGVHNREHKLNVVLRGKRRVGPALVTSVAVVEVRVEISFDPVDREVGGFLTGWTLRSNQGNFHGGGDLRRALHARLDPRLWQQFRVTRIPGTAKDPIAVLSVKTQSDGRVAVYFEP